MILSAATPPCSGRHGGLPLRLDVDNAGAWLPSFRRRLGSSEQPSIWLRPHKGERIPHSRRRSWGWALLFGGWWCSPFFPEVANTLCCVARAVVFIVHAIKSWGIILPYGRENVTLQHENVNDNENFFFLWRPEHGAESAAWKGRCTAVE